VTRAAFIYDEALSRHVLREDHVLQPSRLQLTFELLDSYHAFDSPTSSLVKPRQAHDSELLSFHTREYLAAVRGFSRGEMLADPAAFNFSDWGDNPIFPGMYEASALGAGASLVAVEQVLSGEVEVAFNISGGLHHAAPGHASGFCIFNDPAIAVMRAVNEGMRVAYVDIDAHHGDGVQNAFYADDRVLTVSLHESGRYLFPGSGGAAEIGAGVGTGYAVSVPLAPYTDDETYLWAFAQVVPLVARFEPDLLVSQLGCDSHYLDPLTHLNLTTQGYTGVVRQMKGLNLKWVALGGGGYEMGVVARCWTLAYGVMAERDFPDEIPESFRHKYGLNSLRDAEGPSGDEKLQEQVRLWAEHTVSEVQRLVFPYHCL